MLLSIRDLSVSYGAISALRGINLHVNQGELVALVGANGAGKSTLMNTTAGVLRPQQGSITFDGQPITGRSPEDISRRGLALVPEGRRIFGSLTVEENLRIGAMGRPAGTNTEADYAAMLERFPILKQRLKQPGGTLSGGEQQQLAIARALMSKPRLLMLDEPSLGLAPVLVDEIFSLISGLRVEGISLLVVEQNVERALKLCDRVYLLRTGSLAFAGLPEELYAQIDLTQAYLGSG